MRHIRFTISSLLIAVLFAGFGFAALRESNETWESSIFSITLVMLSISILLAVHRIEKRRAFWLGFALFGSAYLALSFVPSIESKLITTKALHFLDSKVTRSIPARPVSFDPYEAASWDLVFVNDLESSAIFRNNGNGGWIKDVTSAAGSNPPSFPNIVAGSSLAGSSSTTENFVKIGHSLLAVIVASLGGYISRYLYTKNREAVKESAIPDGSTSPDRSGN